MEEADDGGGDGRAEEETIDFDILWGRSQGK